MFVTRMTFRTTCSEVRFEVVDVMTGKVVMVTRDPGRAVTVTAGKNSGN